MKRRTAMMVPIYTAAAAAIVPSTGRAALVPPHFLNCVAAIGYSGPGVLNGVNVPQMWHTVGTGFFYGALTQPDPDQAKRLYDTYLVTAKHVVAGYAEIQRADPRLGSVKVRINPISSSSKSNDFDLINGFADPSATWVDNPNGKDLSVIPVNLQFLRDSGYQSAFFINDEWVANIDKMRTLGVSEGDGIFVLGFPMDMAGIERNYVIVRQGIVARIKEMLDRASDSFLIDSFVFPGNSGGPIILKPEIVSITGTAPQSNAYLIGLVVEYRPYPDIAFSAQTHRPRIIFEENSGLATVLPVDYIEDTIKEAQRRRKP